MTTSFASHHFVPHLLQVSPSLFDVHCCSLALRLLQWLRSRTLSSTFFPRDTWLDNLSTLASAACCACRNLTIASVKSSQWRVADVSWQTRFWVTHQVCLCLKRSSRVATHVCNCCAISSMFNRFSSGHFFRKLRRTVDFVVHEPLMVRLVLLFVSLVFRLPSSKISTS